MSYAKDTAGQTIDVACFSLFSGLPADGGSVTCTISQDGGNFVALADASQNTPTGATGVRRFSLSQSETNCSRARVRASCSVAGVVADDLLVFFSTASAGAPTAAAVADAVWDEPVAGHLGDGSFGERMALFATFIGAVHTSVGAGLSAAVAAIKAVVDSIKLRTDTLGAASITVTSPMTAGGDLTIVAGDVYSGARAIPVVITGWTGPSVYGAAAHLRILRTSHWAGEDVAAERTWPLILSQMGTTVSGSLTLSAYDTSGLRTAPPAGEWNYRWQLRLDTLGITVGGAVDPLATGRMRVVKRIG
jgi:hypothetical protein